MGTLRRVFDQPLVDVVGRGLAKEIETEGLAQRRQVQDRIVDDISEKRKKHGNRYYLQDNRARFLVAPKPKQVIGLATDLLVASLADVVRHPYPLFVPPL